MESTGAEVVADPYLHSGKMWESISRLGKKEIFTKRQKVIFENQKILQIKANN